MTGQKRMAGSDDLQTPDDRNGKDHQPEIRDPALQPADLRTLIESRKENAKQLNIRLMLLQAIIEGADSAIFSLDTRCCYSSFNKKHARDMQDIYGTVITVGENPAVFIPIEKDLEKLLHLIRQALAGEQGALSDYFGDNARSRRYFDLSCYPIRNADGQITGAAIIATDTTVRKKSERKLAEREERFRRLAENTPDFLYRISLPKGTFEYVSQSSRGFTGYPPEEFLQKPGRLYELVHPSWKDAFGRDQELLMKGKTLPAREYQIVHRNGDFRWWHVRTTVVRDAAGHPVAAEGVVTDITDRKKEQIALEETNERFRTIIDSAGAGIVLVDAETHAIVDANPRALEMIGAPRETVIGAVCHRFICQTQDGRSPVTDPDERMKDSEQSLLTADGRTIPVLRTVVPVTISGRDLLIDSFLDLSDQKKTEEALRQSEERYRAFIANSSEGIFRFAMDCEIPTSLPPDEQVALIIRHGYLAECNDPMARMYGYERKETLAGKQLGTVLDVEKPGTLEHLRNFIMNGYQSADYETEERDRSGNTRWFTTSMTGIVQNNCLVAIWGIRRDSTDRKSTEMTIRQSEERYRDVVDHSVDIIGTFSFNGEIISLSPAVLPLLGYTPEELIGKNIRELFEPESLQRLQEEIDRKKNGSASDAFFEVELRAQDGRLIPFEVNIRIRSEGQKNPDLVINAREIFARKKSADALKESEERFRILLERVPSVAVQGFRPDYTVISWNEATTKMFGYTAEDAIGKDIRELLFPSDTREEITGICDRMAMTGTNGPSAEREFLHKDGMRVPVFISHSVVKNPGKNTVLFCLCIDLTERKKAENAVRDAEHHLQSILDVAPFGTVVWELYDDSSLVFVSGNRSASRILGTDCTRFIGKTFEDAFPDLASTGIPDLFRKVIRDGEPLYSDAAEYGAEGIPGIFEVHAIPLAQNRITVFFRDISEKKKTEDQLRQTETRFRTLIQNSPNIIQILDKEKRLVYISPSFFTILGYPEGEQTSSNTLDLIHPDDRDRVTADLDKVYNGTTLGTPTEYRMLAADGSYRFMESVGVNLLGAPGVDGVVINTHTVHERKQAEVAIQESEEQFRLIFQHANDAMFLFAITASGMPGKIVNANDVAVRQTGYAKDELVQKNLPELCSRDLSHRSRAIMMELLTRGEVRFETEHVKKDGSLLPIEISARLVKLKDKTYVIAISRDISRRKREDRALRIANQKLQLMNIVAWHDIQNKVTGLRGYVELSKDLVRDEKLKRFMDGEEDVLRVIERQLLYTKEYQEMGIHSPQWVNIPQVLRMIVSFREIGSLKFRMDLHDLEIYCDPGIEKVFVHLIENTRRHGKKATQISVSCHETATGLLLIYEDDGIGIPWERKKDLFVQGGGPVTGFSLFFVHDILEISEMTIQETGEPQKGARFEISVPRGLYRLVREET